MRSVRLGLAAALLGAMAAAGALGSPARADDSAGQTHVAYSPGAPTVEASNFMAWKSERLSNGLISVQVVPAIGGRVIGYNIGGGRNLLWASPQLAGQLPPPSGLGPKGAWLNYGGEKLWPAPQGWDGSNEWPGPPDAVLDGSPYSCEAPAPGAGRASLLVVSRKDARSGIQFSKIVRIFKGSSRVSFRATMTNIDTKPRRWGIWSVTQLDARNPDGRGYNSELSAYCPLNPTSHFRGGYKVAYGPQDNPTFSADPAGDPAYPAGRMLHVRYHYRVGKVAADSSAGWTAVVNGKTGTAFVERFQYQPGVPYPDGASVEYWSQGLGSYRAAGKENVMEDNPVTNPAYLEAEILSPFARLKPGQSYSFAYDWYATNIGGDYPIVDCTPVGVVCEPLTATAEGGRLHVHVRFGVFYVGSARVAFTGRNGERLEAPGLTVPVSPKLPRVLDATMNLPPRAAGVVLILRDPEGRELGELARADIEGL